MRSLGFVLFLAACGFKGTSGAGPVDGDPNATPDADHGGGSDAGSGTPDAFVSSPDATACFGRGLLSLCLDVTPSGDRTLTGNIDTGNAASCTKTITQGAGNPELCVIAANNIIVNSNVTATGSRALVLIAATTIDIQSGSLDVSSRIANPARKGAAANTGTCTGNTVKGGSDTGGGGGGAGGGLGTAGGKGGTGDSNDNGSPNGSAPGSPAGEPQNSPTVLRGGCAGSAGGAASTNQASAGGGGGDGGGGVYLIAGTQIKLTGSVYASGAGGSTDTTSGGERQGGGGGGGGGMIGLDAPSIDGGGRVVANGGGGGGGGSVGRGGAAGADGTTDAYAVRATGGQGEQDAKHGNGGDGARGGAGTDISQIDGAASPGGGGGGGGGLGLIWTYGTVTGSPQMSPARVEKPTR